jgi:hypothetical protein
MNPDDTDTVVRSVVMNNGSPVELDYRLYKTPQGWRVYDINVLGAWLIQAYQQQFNEQIQQTRRGRADPVPHAAQPATRRGQAVVSTAVNAEVRSVAGRFETGATLTHASAKAALAAGLQASSSACSAPTARARPR